MTPLIYDIERSKRKEKTVMNDGRLLALNYRSKITSREKDRVGEKEEDWK